MLVITHEGRFLGHKNVVFAFRDTHTVCALRRHLHNNDPRTFLRREVRQEDVYRIVRPNAPMPPLNMRDVRVETHGVVFMWRLIAAGCELFVVTELEEEPAKDGAVALYGVHAGLPGRGDVALKTRNLMSLLEHDQGLF